MTKVTILVKEQNVSVISTDVNGISLCITNIFSEISRMSVLHRFLAWKKSTLGKIRNTSIGLTQI